MSTRPIRYHVSLINDATFHLPGDMCACLDQCRQHKLHPAFKQEFGPAFWRLKGALFPVGLIFSAEYQRLNGK
jgi:hypothetical protein